MLRTVILAFSLFVLVTAGCRRSTTSSYYVPPPPPCPPGTVATAAPCPPGTVPAPVASPFRP